MDLVEACGEVTRGHRVASGACRDPRFPDGTILPQLPFLRFHVPGFDDYLGGPAHPGTINIAFQGARVEMLTPEFSAPAVRWTDWFPPESFYLSRAALLRGADFHPAFIYLPDPATKPDHLQPRGTIELLAAFVPGLAYGDAVTLAYSPAALALVRGDR